MLNDIDFNRLKVFYRIYSQQSIGGAAKELNVTPSAVSQHLKKLEQEIRVRLFTRMHKRLVPTVEADRLFAILKPFLGELQAGLTLFQNGKDEPSGLLRIGAPVEFGKAFFPKVMALFRKQYGEVTFSLTLGNSERLLAMVKSGELDFAMVDLFASQRKYVADLGTYHVEPVIDEEVILACSAAYFHARLKGNVSPDHILTQDFISYERSHQALNGWFRHHFGKQSVKPSVVLTVDSVQAVRSAIESDMGLGVVTRNAIRDQLDRGTVTPIKTGKREIVNKISLVQLQDKVPTFTEKTAQSYFREALREISQ
ncbi:LysR family transcriptional regulator [Desulfoluna spongiiphila]|uniref:DNA-binding transcriptional regulator, LysR family n=1 Tax=Desulfoluna spongiiphila TaxID=419481 RepID=A0A1G5JBW6_9BACT|nr:LysR family transcriptional regulator [Desulfoluna spongiiphila]SCY85401.1 DNA-binding transcriptional regulator, LysR family [Desulfoluna spongiiphila]